MGLWVEWLNRMGIKICCIGTVWLLRRAGGGCTHRSELLMQEVKRLRAAGSRSHLTSRTTRGAAAPDTKLDSQPSRQVRGPVSLALSPLSAP